MKENSTIIYLRGHHLLCLQGYQGYGYDKKFEANTSKILDELNNAKSQENVILTESSDDLCEFCPNLKESICCGNINLSDERTTDIEIIENNENIIKKDSFVLKKANLKKNRKYSFSRLIATINETFPKTNDVKEVCGNCEWIDKCLWYQSRI